MMAGTIPIMRPRLPDADALRPYLEKIDESGWYSNFGPLERQLEVRLADRYGLPGQNVSCVANCTAGLTLALMELAGARGGYCVMPSFTFVASAHAVVAAGLSPMFVDVDAGSWGVTTAQAAAAIAAADGPVAAVMVVSPFGAPVDVLEWDRFAETSGVPVVVDAAGGFDSLVPCTSPVVVSLHATKVLPAGEGGFVVSRDADLIRSVSARANFGFFEERRSDVAGFNGKLSEYCAAVGLAALDAWPESRAALLVLTALYREAFSGLGNISLAPGFGDGWVGSTCNIAFDQPVADKAMSNLSQVGIDSRQWWSKGCHREMAFKDYPHLDLPVTEALGQRVLGLPFHTGLDSADIRRIAECIGAVG